ncbi:MAG: glycosyltransferase family 87 protein [Gemmatales bacterium]
MTWLAILREAACWPFQREQRHVIAWVLSVILTIYLLHTSLREGCNGHSTCDFAGQWMHGRFFYREITDQLYLVKPGEQLLAEGYSDKEYTKHVDDILKKGYRQDLYDQGIAGALYPPTASLAFSMFAQFTPAVGHAAAVCVYLALCYIIGWFIHQITQGRLQWGEAVLLTLFFPNNFMGLMLGQNQVLTMFILTLGWYCHSRRMPFVAGLVWGLFSYKPVFAVALLLVPIALRSPRWFLGMALSGMFCILATLPFTKGIDPWRRWLQVGNHAEQIYQTDRNWVWMSRDLVGLPRRKMWDAESFIHVWRANVGVWQPGACWSYTDTESGRQIVHPQAWLFFCDDHDIDLHQLTYMLKDGKDERSPPLQTLIGYLLLGTVAAGTVLMVWLTSPSYNRASDTIIHGPVAILLLTGSLLSVFHFMHYDLLSFALPVLIGLGYWNRWRWGRRTIFLVWYLLWLSRTYSFFFGSAILNVPWETYLLLLLWMWMLWMCWRDRRLAFAE